MVENSKQQKRKPYCRSGIFPLPSLQNMSQYAEHELIFMYRPQADGQKTSGRKGKTQFVKISKGKVTVIRLK